MAYTNAKDLMTAICDAVREKEGSSNLIPHQELPERIRGISGGGNVSYVLPSFFANLNNDLVKTYNSTDRITCEVGHTYLVFTTYLIGASYVDSQYISVNGADILRDASFIMTGSDGSGGGMHNTHISSFIITVTQTNVTVQHRFSIGFESKYQTVITLDITDNVNEITDREMLSVPESNSFQSNAGKYYLVLLGSIVGTSTSVSTSAEIIYQSNITTGTSAYNHLTSMVLMIVKSTADSVTASLNSTSSKNALFYMDISNKVSGGGTVVDKLKYKIVTVSAGGFDASIRVDNLANGTSTAIPYKSVENGSYEDFGDFRISYGGQSDGWCVTCTTEMLFVGSAILLEGEKINWLYNKSVEYDVKVRTVQSEPSTSSYKWNLSVGQNQPDDTTVAWINADIVPTGILLANIPADEDLVDSILYLKMSNVYDFALMGTMLNGVVNHPRMYTYKNNGEIITGNIGYYNQSKGEWTFVPALNALYEDNRLCYLAFLNDLSEKYPSIINDAPGGELVLYKEKSSYKYAYGVTSNISAISSVASGITFGAWFAVQEAWSTALYSFMAIGSDSTSATGIILQWETADTVTVVGPTNSFKITINYSPEIGNWFHVAISYANGIIKVYLNGVLVSTLEKTVSLSTSTLYIGRGPWGNNHNHTAFCVRGFFASETEIDETNVGYLMQGTA